jgi:hypothetical protein
MESMSVLEKNGLAGKGHALDQENNPYENAMHVFV